MIRIKQEAPSPSIYALLLAQLQGTANSPGEGFFSTKPRREGNDELNEQVARPLLEQLRNAGPSLFVYRQLSNSSEGTDIPRNSQEAEMLGLRLNHLMSGDSQAGALYAVIGRETGCIPSMSSNVLVIGGEILGWKDSKEIPFSVNVCHGFRKRNGITKDA